MRIRLFTHHAIAALLTCNLPQNEACAQVGSLREPGAIYLEDSMRELPRIKIQQAAAAFIDSKGSRQIGIFPAGETVELQAVSDTFYRVKGRATHGQIAGWVLASYLTKLKPEFLQALKLNEQRRVQVAELIARNEVAIGMTSEEVQQSLGRPQRRSTRVDANRRKEIWEFVKFERQPQKSLRYDQFGRPYWATVFVKVEVGSLSIVFENDIVAEIEESEDHTRRTRQRIIIQPMELVW